MISAEGDYLTQGKKSLPIAVLNNTCKKHYLLSTPYPYPPYNKGGKGKGKDRKSKDGKHKGKKEPPQASSSVSDDSELSCECFLIPRVSTKRTEATSSSVTTAYKFE
jgi:hypothetical protein